jgi:hypothetical protein
MEDKKAILKRLVSFWFYGCFDSIFYTLSKNILHTYTLPITMPIMFLMVYWWEDFTRKVLILPDIPIIAFIGYTVLVTECLIKK